MNSAAQPKADRGFPCSAIAASPDATEQIGIDRSYSG